MECGIGAGKRVDCKIRGQEVGEKLKHLMLRSTNELMRNYVVYVHQHCAANRTLKPPVRKVSGNQRNIRTRKKSLIFLFASVGITDIRTKHNLSQNERRVMHHTQLDQQYMYS